EYVANFGEKDCEKSRRPESLDCRASFGSLRNSSHSSAAHLLCRMAHVSIGKHQGEKYVPTSLWRRSLCSHRGGRSGPGHCRDLELLSRARWKDLSPLRSEGI